MIKGSIDLNAKKHTLYQAAPDEPNQSIQRLYFFMMQRDKLVNAPSCLHHQIEFFITFVPSPLIIFSADSIQLLFFLPRSWWSHLLHPFVFSLLKSYLTVHFTLYIHSEVHSNNLIYFAYFFCTSISFFKFMLVYFIIYRLQSVIYPKTCPLWSADSCNNLPKKLAANTS